MKTVLTLLCCAALAGSAQAQVDSAQLLKDVETLAADKYMGRKTGTKGNRMAQFYLLDRFRKAGIQPMNGTFEQPFYFNRGTERIMGTNLYGYILGKIDSVIVISAHYDHVGVSPGLRIAYSTGRTIMLPVWQPFWALLPGFRNTRHAIRSSSRRSTGRKWGSRARRLSWPGRRFRSQRS